MTIAYEGIVEKFKILKTNDPISSTTYGIHDKDNLMPEFTIDEINEETNTAKELLNGINQISIESLNFNEQIDYKIMKLELEKIIFTNNLKYNDLFDYEQKPIFGSVCIEALMIPLLKDPRDIQIRLLSIHKRIDLIPNCIKNYKQVLKKVVSRWKGIEIEEVEGLNDLFENIISVAIEKNYGDIENLKVSILKAKDALNEYTNFINSLDELNEFSIGYKNTQELIRLNGINLSINEIYTLAKDFFKEHYKIKKELVEKIKLKYKLDENLTLDEVIEYIKEKYSIPVDKVVKSYQDNQDKISNFLQKNDLFVYPKSHKMHILQTPSYLVPSIPVGAIFVPSPYQNDPLTSITYITVDEGRLKDQNDLMITNTMIHEGIPGHHLQFSMAYENDSTIRKLANYNTHAEGWTTYLEGFMTTTGFIKDEIIDEYELIGIADFARLGARVGIDLYFMTGDETFLNIIEDFEIKDDNELSNFEKAQYLLQLATGFTNARAQGELNWYSKERGYPMCYLIGNRVVIKMQKEIVEKLMNRGLSKNEALKEFHKTYLEEGIMPLHFLEEIFENKY